MNKMKNLEINKNAVKKLSMAALITSSLMLGGCGSSNTDKPKDEPTTDLGTKVDEKIPFEKMTEDEMNLLVAGDIVTKLPDREYLNSKDLDFLFVYDQWIKTGDSDYPKESQPYYTTQYQKDGEIFIEVDNVIESCENYKLKEIVIGKVEYSKIEGSNEWYEYIYLTDDFAVPTIISSKEKIEQLNSGVIHDKKKSK